MSTRSAMHVKQSCMLFYTVTLNCSSRTKEQKHLSLEGVEHYVTGVGLEYWVFSEDLSDA